MTRLRVRISEKLAGFNKKFAQKMRECTVQEPHMRAALETVLETTARESTRFYRTRNEADVRTAYNLDKTQERSFATFTQFIETARTDIEFTALYHAVMKSSSNASTSSGTSNMTGRPEEPPFADTDLAIIEENVARAQATN